MTATLNNRGIGTPRVLFFVLAGAAPLTVFGGVIPGAYGVTGLLGIPAVFLATGLILALFAVGYVAMSRRIVHPGAFYTYIAHGLGRVVGVAAANVAVLAYSLLQVGLYGGFGAVVAGYTHERFGWNRPWWQFAVAAWVLVLFLGLMRVRLSSTILGVLLVGEVAVAFVLDLVMIANPSEQGLTLTTFDPGLLFTSGISAAFVTAVTAFSGFESAVVLSGEARNPKVTIARATYLALGFTAVFYAVSAWAMSVAAGPGQIVARAAAESGELVFNLGAGHLPAFVIDAGHMLFATSLFAALLVFHNAVARYLFSLGRESVAPSAFGMASPRTGAPVVASLVQSMSAAGVIALYAAAGWEPFTHLFFWLGMSGGFGLLILMIVCSFAVAAYFYYKDTTVNTWKGVVLPLFAGVALSQLLYLTVTQYDVLLGVEPGHPATWAIPSSFAVAAALGAGWALYLKLFRPAVYAQIGLGAQSTPAGADV